MFFLTGSCRGNSTVQATCRATRPGTYHIYMFFVYCTYIYFNACQTGSQRQLFREIPSCRESNPVIASPKCATITVTLFVQSLPSPGESSSQPRPQAKKYRSKGKDQTKKMTPLADAHSEGATGGSQQTMHRYMGNEAKKSMFTGVPMGPTPPPPHSHRHNGG